MKYGYKILLLFFLLPTIYVCKGQNVRLSCIEQEHITSHSCHIQTNTNNLLSLMSKPVKVSYDKKENFLILDTFNVYHTYSQLINIFWYKDVGYRDVNGLASLYWISFKHNHFSIIIDNQVISKNYTLENFQRNFYYDEENTYFQDRKKNLVCQDDSRMYYTYISIPICNGAGGECLVFCFNKKGNIDNVQFYTITHLNIQ